MTKRGKLILLACAVVYALGYVGLRETHFILHRSTYYTDEQGVARTLAHFVETGDFGPLSKQRGFLVFQLGVVFFYLPPTLSERLYWYLAVPLGSEWPYMDRLVKSSAAE